MESIVLPLNNPYMDDMEKMEKQNGEIDV